jgi:hypothetical protein
MKSHAKMQVPQHRLKVRVNHNPSGIRQHRGAESETGHPQATPQLQQLRIPIKLDRHQEPPDWWLCSKPAFFNAQKKRS